MISKYIREGQHYSKKNLIDLFELEGDRGLEEFSRKLILQGVLKRVDKNSKEELLGRDEEEIEDAEVNRMDRTIDSKNVSYVFRYVGVIVQDKWIIKCYPKYKEYVKSDGITHTTKKTYDKNIKLAIKAIEKANKKHRNLDVFDNESDEVNNPLGIMLLILEDYFEYGVYINQQRIIENNGNGEVNWNRTVNYNNAIIQDNVPYYTEFYTNRTVNNNYDYFKRLHECIVSECSRELQEYGLDDLLDIVTNNISDEELDDFGDVDYIVYKLQSEMNVQFNTRKVNLLKLLEIYVKKCATENKVDSIKLYGTKSFHTIWEKACAEVFDSKLTTNFTKLGKELKNKYALELPEEYQARKKDNLLSIIEKPKWGTNQVEADQTLKPDLISFYKEEPNSDVAFTILDAKYYLINFTKTNKGNKVSGQPGVGDLTKQFLYQLAYKEFTDKLGIKIIRNCFLMPLDWEENDGNNYAWHCENLGEATMNMLVNLSLQPIKIRKISAQWLLENYVNNKKIDVLNSHGMNNLEL